MPSEDDVLGIRVFLTIVVMVSAVVGWAVIEFILWAINNVHVGATP